MTPTYFPSWLPIPHLPWILVDVKSGAWWPRPGKEEASKRFATAEAALAYAQRHGIPLAEGLK